jgi:transcriptional regulatory protein LEU3
MNLECRILPTSTRNLRQTKAEMRRELEELRWNLRQGGGDLLSTPGSLGDASSFRSPHDPANGSFSDPSAPRTDASMSPSLEHGPNAGKDAKATAAGPTVTRALDGFVVDARKIDDCFALFFTQYHPLLPILDSSLSPNSANGYYELSPLLFWCIVVTGARHYLEDRSILDKVSQLITPLAFSSMALRAAPMSVIQSLLILCTWRLPTNSMYKDMTHVLCGAAVHLATQIGLHVTGVGQDFARTPLKTDQEQKIIRAKLWMQCVIVSIRTSCAEGIPPLVIAESFYDGDETDREDLFAFLPPDLQFNHHLHIILHKAMAAMARTDIKTVNCDARNLRSLITIFDSQLLTLAGSSPSELGKWLQISLTQ